MFFLKIIFLFKNMEFFKIFGFIVNILISFIVVFIIIFCIVMVFGREVFIKGVLWVVFMFVGFVFFCVVVMGVIWR